MILKAATRLVTVSLLSVGCGLLASPVQAQGQDSTPAQRYLRVLAQLLPGVYDNANQNYFDRRRQLAEADRHARMHLEVSSITAPRLGEHVFLWTTTVTVDDKTRTSYRLVSLSADGPDDAVVMTHFFDRERRIDSAVADQTLAALRADELTSTPGCEYYLKRRAESFRGQQRGRACQFDWEGQRVYTSNTIEWSREDAFINDHKVVLDTGERISGVASGEPYWLERARTFSCFVDVPGVGGGRDEVFERYDGISLHDKGGSHWLKTRGDNPQQIGVALQSVSWHVLNENNGNFNRDSLVVYVMERLADGTVKEHGYGFTEPNAERIGINLKWMLVNCALVPPGQAQPQM